jgi:hypothetical protein
MLCLNTLIIQCERGVIIIVTVIYHKSRQGIWNFQRIITNYLCIYWTFVDLWTRALLNFMTNFSHFKHPFKGVFKYLILFLTYTIKIYSAMIAHSHFVVDLRIAYFKGHGIVYIKVSHSLNHRLHGFTGHPSPQHLEYIRSCHSWTGIFICKHIIRIAVVCVNGVLFRHFVQMSMS